MSRDELITLVAQRDAQIAAMAGQLSELIEANEVLAGKLAKLEHLLSRNNKNSRVLPPKTMIPAGPRRRVARTVAADPSGPGASSGRYGNKSGLDRDPR